MGIRRFEEIEAWKAARRLLQEIAPMRTCWKDSVECGIGSQRVGAATSAMANIAEGFDSGTDREFRRFLRIARRSATEFQSHLSAAVDLGMIDDADFHRLHRLAADVRNLTWGFIRYLNTTAPDRPFRS